MIVKIFAFSVHNFPSKCSKSKLLINSFINSDCGNMKVQNNFLAKFKIMKLKIDACSIFMTFLSAVPKNL